MRHCHILRLCLVNCVNWDWIVFYTDDRELLRRLLDADPLAHLIRHRLMRELLPGIVFDFYKKAFKNSGLAVILGIEHLTRGASYQQSYPQAK